MTKSDKCERRVRRKRTRGLNASRRGRPTPRRESPSSQPSADFLAALQAQRASIAQREEASPSNSPTGPESESEVPGFYYDDKTRKYYRESSTRRKPKQVDCTIESASVRPKIGNWTTYLQNRERQCGWTSSLRSRRKLVPHYLSASLAHAELTSVYENCSDRLTAAAFHPRLDIGAIGFGSGRVTLFNIQSQRPSQASPSNVLDKNITVAHELANGPFLISSMCWRPDMLNEFPSYLLYSCVGTDAANFRDDSRSRGGCVMLYRDMNARMDFRREKWFLIDPWTVTWDPYHSGMFSVGLSGRRSAAYVDPNAMDGVIYAPKGVIQSDVLSQAFLHPNGQTILNGTRNGSTWWWDTRTQKRAQECAANDKSGAVLDLHALRDGVSTVAQYSDGALKLADVRMNRTVVEYAAGDSRNYVSMLRCALDEQETVVVAPTIGTKGKGAVLTYDRMTGAIVSHLESNRNNTLDSPIEQVHMRMNGHEENMEIWALRRHDMLATHARST